MDPNRRDIGSSPPGGTEPFPGRGGGTDLRKKKKAKGKTLGGKERKSSSGEGEERSTLIIREEDIGIWGKFNLTAHTVWEGNPGRGPNGGWT